MHNDDNLIALLKRALKLLEESTAYTSSAYSSPSMTEDIDYLCKIIRAEILTSVSDKEQQ